MFPLKTGQTANVTASDNGQVVTESINDANGIIVGVPQAYTVATATALKTQLATQAANIAAQQARVDTILSTFTPITSA